MRTLYVWFPASWAPMVAERLFGWSSHPRGPSYPQSGRPASGPPQTHFGAHPWHQHDHDAAGASGAMEEPDSTEVVYKIRQWSLPGAAIVPVLNVSSRVFWLELDDKALLDSYTVLQEGILCDVFSQKCSAAWQGARGERLTVAIMLPGRQDADDWLNFMLSQKNLWPTFTTRGTLTEEVSEQVIRVRAVTPGSPVKKQSIEFIFGLSRGGSGVHTISKRPPPQLDLHPQMLGLQPAPLFTDEEKPYRGAANKEVQAWWKQCKDWMEQFRERSTPFAFDFKSLLQALSQKEAEAQSEVDAFMKHCAKRWQTREGTYQLKRRRLKPDVRDLPEEISADVDMADI